MMPKPRIQKIGVPSEKSIRFFIMMLPAFFALVKPVSTIAKPACMKNTSAAATSVQPTSIDVASSMISIFITPLKIGMAYISTAPEGTVEIHAIVYRNIFSNECN